MTELLRLEGVTLTDRTTGSRLLDEIKISVKTNRTLALVGESGSGKSLLAKAILGLLPETLQRTGEIYWRGQPIKAFQGLRGKHIGLIVQQAMSAFNPLMPLGRQFIETLRVHYGNLSKDAMLNMAEQALQQVQLTPPNAFLAAYPHQLSGGQLQRLMLALTLAIEPALIVADEPTTALDSVTQAQLLPCFQQIAQQQGRALLFITHDMMLAKCLADEIAVLHHGKLIEWQASEALFAAPQQPYTRYLLAMSDKLNRHVNQIK